MKISQEGLSLCHGQINGSGPCKRIMGESPTEGFVHAQSWARRAARARTKNSLEVFYPVAKSNKMAPGRVKQDMVVPTGFEPVFKP
jgi:hypothetical protein